MKSFIFLVSLVTALPELSSIPCGNGVKGNGICQDTTKCCSLFGWCGLESWDCGYGCLSGPCTPVDKLGCGNGHIGSGVCADTTQCCSKYGWCGRNSECEFGCLSGPCISSNDLPCGGGNIGNGKCTDPSKCCSQWGWCGSGNVDCGVGCLSGPCIPRDQWKCGMGVVGSGVCNNPEECCSSQGWCGKPNELPNRCGFGCLSGPCQATDKLGCGMGNIGSGICDNPSLCCSNLGWCSLTAYDCGHGCLSGPCVPASKQKCGKGNIGTGICDNPLECCSYNGFCGLGQYQCGYGCLSGPCTPLAKLPCGNGYVGSGKCTNTDECCSKYGWCGKSFERCGTNCLTSGENCFPLNGTCGLGNIGNRQCYDPTQCCDYTGQCNSKGSTSCQIGKCLGGPCTVVVSCGNGVIGNGQCEDNSCCSKTGFCGLTSTHCGVGCLSGPCLTPQTCKIAGTLLADGTGYCGGGKVGNGNCQDPKECCSSNGICSASLTNCGVGCIGGPCTLTTGTCGAGKRGNGICSDPKKCCSLYGYCDANYCNTAACVGGPCLGNLCGNGIIGNAVCANSSLVCSQLGYCVTPESLNPPMSVIDTLRTFGTYGLRVISSFGLRITSGFGLRIAGSWGLRITESGAVVADVPESNSSVLPITFGGKILNSTDINIYLYYYGNWAQSAKDTINFFVENIGSPLNSPNPWGDVVQQYYHDSDGIRYYVGTPKLAKTYSDPAYEYGKVLSDKDIQNILTCATQGTSPRLAHDPNGIFFVLGAADVQNKNPNNGSCTDYCGWHNWMNGGFGFQPNAGVHFNYFGYVHNPSTCLSQCGDFLNNATSLGSHTPYSSPNGDVNIDSMVKFLWHELVEFATDANGDAWLHPETGEEMVDLCHFQYGLIGSSVVKVPGQYYYNIEVKDVHQSKKYLLEQIWDIRTNKCSLGNTLPTI